jgi:hypothetical protein
VESGMETLNNNNNNNNNNNKNNNNNNNDNNNNIVIVITNFMINRMKTEKTKREKETNQNVAEI